MFKTGFILSLFKFENMEKILYIVLAICVVCIIGIIFIKSDGFRKICGILLSFIVIFAGVVSGFSLNAYYKSAGGIVGKLSQILDPNYVDISVRDEIEFNFKSIMLAQVENEKYRAEFTTDDFIELEPRQAYAVFVNDMPCELIEYGENYVSSSISSDYLISEFYYSFLDENLDFILKDKLIFRFAFYKNSTRLIVETNGGSESVALWNSFFQKNKFIVTIKPMDKLFMTKYSTVTIFNKNEKISTIRIKNGSTYIFPILEKDGYRFDGFSYDGSNLTSETEKVILENLNLYAHFNKYYSAFFCFEKRDDIGFNDNVYSYKEFCIGDKLSSIVPENPSLSNRTFKGWSYDGVNVIDSDYELSLTDSVKERCILYAVWESDSFSIPIDLDGGKLTIDSVEKSSNFSIDKELDDLIYFVEPSKTDYVFDKYLVTFVMEDNTVGLYINDKNFNKSLSEIITDYNSSFVIREEETVYLVDIKSVSIKLCFIAGSSDVESISDTELIEYICQSSLVPGSIDGNYPETCEDTVRYMYSNVSGSSSSDKTMYEILVELNQVFEFHAEITEQTTARKFLEIAYLSLKGQE